MYTGIKSLGMFLPQTHLPGPIQQIRMYTEVIHSSKINFKIENIAIKYNIFSCWEELNKNVREKKTKI